MTNATETIDILQPADTAWVLTQARALLAQTFGHGGDSFRELTPDMQDAYLSAVDELLVKACTLAG
ncbi:hypothetical protein D9M69_537480 [compost metagenome]